MAFTETQRALIRRYLGYPDLFRSRNTRLESAMDVVGNDRPETEALIVADLASLATVDVAIASALASGGLKRIDDIEFYPGAQLLSVANEGRKFASRISIALGVPIVADAFGRDGYLGDGWMSPPGAFPLG